MVYLDVAMSGRVIYYGFFTTHPTAWLATFSPCESYVQVYPSVDRFCQHYSITTEQDKMKLRALSGVQFDTTMKVELRDGYEHQKQWGRKR